MISFKCTTFILLLTISVCLAQDESHGVARKRLKHKLHHLHHNPYIYYLAFLAIKLKFALVIGTMIMLALFASKTYALLKYGILTKMSKEPEKIYIQQSEHHPSYFSPDDHDHEHHDHDFASAPSSYGRGFEDQNEMFTNFNLVHDIVNKFDLNEFAFNELDIKDTECRERFVCEAEQRANNDTLLSIGMYLIRDKNFIKYKTHETISTLADCAKLCLV